MAELIGTAVYQALHDTFRRYLFTAHRIAESEPELRAAFWDALGREDLMARVPILSAIPAYATSATIEELVAKQASPALHPSLLKLGDSTRPLYRHQVAAIRAIQDGQSVAIATGTGSGKTESFLLPILDDILRDPSPGVRALIVYPLNALANDQLRRLRELLKTLPEITFGRYTGESPQTKDDIPAVERTEILEPNERASREALRADPPHIVLTNFAMLEYLLLRPRDAPLFSAGSLKFVVLDEAHVYQGAQGIDVGLLMRRLNRRVNRPLQYVLTSATLGGDAESIAAFGFNLTGASIAPSAVIRGEATTGFNAGNSDLRSLDEYARLASQDGALQAWAKALDSEGALRKLLNDHGKGHVAPTSRGLYEWLCDDARLEQLHTLLSSSPLGLPEASRQLWGEDSVQARRATEWLCLLGARATRDSASSPLLPARYHFLFRGLRGATVCLSPACGARPAASRSRAWSHLMLEGRATCERCDANVLPMLTCFTCGLPVFRVCEDTSGSAWQQLPPSGHTTRPKHLLTWWDGSDDEDAEARQNENATLCLACRRMSIGDSLDDCCAAPIRVQLKHLAAEDDGSLKRCPNCGSQARRFPSVLRDFITGEDAAGAVLTEELIRALPQEDASLPAGGRRVLAFSDSRQRAAYFAPYLSRTAAETQVMAPLVEAIDAVLKQDPRGATIDEVAYAFSRRVEKQPYVILRRPLDDAADEFKSDIKRAGSIAADDRVVLRRDAKVALLRHFTSAPRRRDTLPGLALGTVELDLSEEQQDAVRAGLKGVAERVGVSSRDGLVQSLLRVMVRRRALAWPDDVVPAMIGPGPTQTTLHATEAGPHDGRVRVRWNAYRAVSGVEGVVRRSPQVALVAACLGLDDPVASQSVIEEVLTTFWRVCRDAQVLQEFAPNEYVIPYDRLVVVRDVSWSVCSRCGAVVSDPPGNRCPMPGCAGDLTPMESEGLRWDSDHQRRRFTHSGALPLNVKEHTAQLTQTAGRDYQRRFTAGEINVLSCSTTFEMGVDVGQLRAVYLRNVPPTAANYIQRAGRAGRRREGVALALTFVRNMPHDQVSFYEPSQLLSGTVAVPRVSLRNPKLAQRHANAWMLAAFLAANGTVQDNATVDEFFFTPDEAQSPRASYASWITANRSRLVDELTSVLRESALGPEDAVDRSASGLTETASEVASERDGFEQQIAELESIIRSVPSDVAAVANNLKRVRALREQALKERLIDTLSSRHWLPSYAFPQDVVRLRVLDPAVSARFKLERDAEYGISEYAPGAEVIADGKLITSGALDLGGRTPHVRRYRLCQRCHNVEVSERADALQGPCSVCGGTWKGVGSAGRPFVVPRGFSTTFDTKASEVRLSRVTPPRNTEVFLVQGAPPEAFQAHPMLKGIQVGLQADGRLFLANSGRRGRGFGLCMTCGRYLERGGRHLKPWGARCDGVLSFLDLGYEFETDTLQIRFGGVSPTVPPISNEPFWRSIEMAVVTSAADLLDIAPRDIAATHRAQKAGGLAGELVVYDRVPGGAGYVGRIVDNLPEVLHAALDRVERCPNPQCDILGSCYACLRSYYNQMQWDELRRHEVADWLKPALDWMSDSPGTV